MNARLIVVALVLGTILSTTAGPEQAGSGEWFGIWAFGDVQQRVVALHVRFDADGATATLIAVPDIIDESEWSSSIDFDEIDTVLGFSSFSEGRVDAGLCEAATACLAALTHDQVPAPPVFRSKRDPWLFHSGAIEWNVKLPDGRTACGNLRIPYFDSRCEGCAEAPGERLMSALITRPCQELSQGVDWRRAASGLPSRGISLLKHIEATSQNLESKALARRALGALGQGAKWAVVVPGEPVELREAATACMLVGAVSAEDDVRALHVLKCDPEERVRVLIVLHYLEQLQSGDAHILPGLERCLALETAPGCDYGHALLAGVLAQSGKRAAVEWFRDAFQALQNEAPVFLSECAAIGISLGRSPTWDDEDEKKEILTRWRQILADPNRLEWDPAEAAFVLRR